jgi:alcohol dehydrogenase
LRALEELTGGDLAQVVIDATGSDRSMSAAYQYVGFAGRLVFVGITQNEVKFGHPLMHRREMTFMASRNALPGDFKRIIGLIEGGKIDTRPWITHRLDFEEVPSRFPGLLDPASGVLKAVIAVGV